MLTEEEKGFIEYWRDNRLRRRKVMKRLAFGLPLATAIVAGIFFSFFTGWYQRADMEFNSSQPSLILVLLGAVLLIVVFVVIFAARHTWDMNEQRYKELLAKDSPEKNL